MNEPIQWYEWPMLAVGSFVMIRFVVRWAINFFSE